MDESLAELEERLGHRFADPGLLVMALTHRSWANERNEEENYERLEFLGDSVLAAITAEWLYHRLEAREGELSKLKGFLVAEPALAAYAEKLGIDHRLRLGEGEERSGGRRKPSLLADAMEAVLGALFLDAGVEAARSVAVPMLEEGFSVFREAESDPDPKTALQEILQARGLRVPDYRLVGERGPDHQKEFFVECWGEGRLLGVGKGSSKKRAEKYAAAAALRVIEHASGGEPKR